MNVYAANAAKEYAIEIAGISMLAKASGNHFELEIPATHEDFVVMTDNPDIELTVHYEEPPELGNRNKLIFDSGATWKLYESDDRYTVIVDNPISGPGIYRLARFNKDFSKGELFVRPYELIERHKSPNGKPMFYPFENPLDEMLIVNKVANGSGIEIHGCAVAYKQKGFLFTGVSGAGKSTLASLWKTRPVEILSDERLIVKRDGAGGFWVHGTPWPSDAGAISTTGVPLDSLYFLAQSPENYVRQLTVAEVMTRLLVTCFPTFYFKDGMQNTVALLESIGRMVPAYEFGFLPDESATGFILDRADT